MKRERFDLSHYSFQMGKMGRLQTLSVIPVLAGDSLTLSLDSLNRLSPLRRSLTMDAKVDTFGFYIPHRHIYGQAWLDLIEQGVDSTVTLPTTTILAGQSKVNKGFLNYLGYSAFTGEVLPNWRIFGYNRIWNRYFRFLKLSPEIPDAYTTFDGIPTGSSAGNSPFRNTQDSARYGFECARLKTPWSTGIDSGITSADTDIQVTANSFSIFDLEVIKRRYKTELEREFFDIRYNDIMKGVFGSGVNIDADERPELLARVSNSIGGFDVDGTGDANLGTFSGKAIGKGQFRIPPKHFNEHGAVWIMQLVRFPTVGFDEVTPFVNNNSPSYLDITGDYENALAVPPLIPDTADWFNFGTFSTFDIGTIPYGQEWRYQNNFIHREYVNLEGYPFFNPLRIGDRKYLTYNIIAEYDDVFSSTQLGHWQSQCAIRCSVKRHFPTTLQSIKSGI